VSALYNPHWNMFTLHLKDPKIKEAYKKDRRESLFKYLVAAQVFQTLTIVRFFVGYLQIEEPNGIILWGNLATFPIFLMPLIFG